TCSQV
ncbi:putative a/G-specific adenine glycosylase, partial [Chlamydia psittaci 84-8471/1]